MGDKIFRFDIFKLLRKCVWMIFYCGFLNRPILVPITFKPSQLKFNKSFPRLLNINEQFSINTFTVTKNAISFSVVRPWYLNSNLLFQHAVVHIVFWSIKQNLTNWYNFQIWDFTFFVQLTLQSLIIIMDFF